MVQDRGVFRASTVYRQPYLCRYGLQNGKYGRRAGQLLDSKSFYLGLAAHTYHSPCRGYPLGLQGRVQSAA